MTNLAVVPRRMANFQSIKGLMSPEFLDIFLDACLEAGISENDCIHAMFAFQAKLLSSGFDAQNTTINETLGAFVSARSQDNKALSTLLDDCQRSIKDSTAAVNKQATVTAHQVESLKADAARMHKEWKEETEKLRRAVSDLDRNLPDVYKAGKIVHEITYGVVWAAIGTAIVASVVATLVVEHFVLHL